MNKFKAEESLTRKLIDVAKLNSQTIEEAGETINDVLRYTFVLSPESFHKTIERLWEKGYYAKTI